MKINYFISICFSSIGCKCPDYRTRQQIHRQLVYRTKTGIITPVSHSAFFKNARPALGIELTKQLTPVSDWEFKAWDI